MLTVKELFSLEGKVVLITGASKGIGRSLMEFFSASGAVVYGFGRSARSEGDVDNISYVSLDITDRENVIKTLQEIFGKVKRVDVLINSAGISLSADSQSNPAFFFEEILKTNLVSKFFFANQVAEFMKNQKKGSIINVSSIGASLAFPNNPGYLASKAGISMVSKSIALDYGKYNIRCNNIVPGYIRTDMTAKSYQNPELRAAREERTILKRWGEVNDLHGAAAFLASDASTYITGTDIVVDGGWLVKGL